MKAFLLGFSIVFAVGVGIVLAMDEAVKPNNPWVLSFILSGLVVPAACGWAAVEVAALLRRRVLQPARSSPMGRALRGVIAAVLGMTGAIVLAAFERPAWPDYVRTAATALPAALLMASVGRRKRQGACETCGYDLRGLTDAAKGRCPECGVEAAIAGA